MGYVEVRWLNKTRTRLPEAHFVGFGTTHETNSWKVEKLGQMVDVGIQEMASGSSAHLHAAGDGGMQTCFNRTCLRVVAVDSAIVSIGQPTPYPTPLVGDETLTVPTSDVYAV